MMKNLSVSLSIWIAIVQITGCSDVKRTRGREYMPDMGYSRAFETYAPHDELKAQGVNYNAMPVPGTIKRGEVFPFPIPRDKDGDSTNYVASRQVVNPLPPLDAVQIKEAERLYLINCGICHGTNLDGNGPLYNGGNGPYAPAPKNLVADPVVSVMPEGQLFYSVTYGKGQMGPYGPQLTTSQRWRIVHFIKSKQKGTATPGAAAGNAVNNPGSTTAEEDTTGVKNLNATPAAPGVR